MKLINVNLCILSFVILCSNYCDSYKILGVFPMPSKSHSIVGGALMKGLAKAGHEVTVISPFPQNKNIPNYRDVSTESIIPDFQKAVANAMDKRNVFSGFKLFTVFGIYTTNTTLNHPNVQAILNNPNEKFDLIIMAVTLNEAILGLGHHYKAPVIGFSTIGSSKWTNDMVGTPAPYSYNPNVFLSFTEKMNFFERIVNTFVTTFEHVYFDWFYLPSQEKIYDEFFPGQKPSFWTLRKNVSLVLLNSHFTLNFPKPYAPNMIEVGGLNVNREKGELPENIKKILDDSTNGIVYFSLGSNVKSSLFPTETKKAILSVLSSLKQTVLWKFEEELKNIPKNVHISSWFPQDGILAHPNTVLFISHGGLLSMTEAIYHGVPIVGIPVLGDQEMNVARAIQNGFGVRLGLHDINEQNFREAVNEILNNKKYSINAKTISARYKDQPKTPMETAIYWVEYVIRHQGAPHMRNPGLDLNFFAYHSIDVYATIIGAILLILYVSKCLIKFVFRMVCKLFTSKNKKIKVN